MDLVMEILTRVPAKSLMRFKCISKLCSSFICSQYFSSRFLWIPSRPRPRLYMCLTDLKNYRKSVILSSAPDTRTPWSSFVVDHDLTIPRMGGYILQNLRGFMYYAFWEKLRIYNPATRQLVSLPAIKSNFTLPGGEEVAHTVSYYFGHDPVNDQDKVICTIGKAMELRDTITVSEHWVFVLEKGGSNSSRLSSSLSCQARSVSKWGYILPGLD